MELKINVDETMFKDIIEKELKAFSKEELHEIIRECIIEAFHNSKDVNDLFIVKRNYWGGYEGSEFLLRAAEKLDLSPAFKEIQDQMIITLKNDYRQVLENAVIRAIRKTSLIPMTLNTLWGMLLMKF